MTQKISKTLLAAALSLAAAGAMAGSDTTTVEIGGSIGASCTASVTPVDAGTVQTAQLFGTGVPVTLTLSVNCSSGAPYQLSLGSAWQYNGMISPESALQLELYDANVWGTPLGPTGSGMAYSGNGIGADQLVAISGATLRGTGRRAAVGAVNATLSSVFLLSY